MTRDEEQALGRAFREAGDIQARNRLVEAHLEAVRRLAHKYASTRAPLEDLVAAGRVGLLRACDTFEPDRGLRFMTYASFWIRSEMLSFVWNSRSLVPAARSKLQRRIYPLRHERARQIQASGDADRVDQELAAATGVSVEVLRQQITEWSRKDLALDEPIGASGLTRLDELTEPGPSSEQVLLDRELTEAQREVVRGALQLLDERERLIVQSHLMASPEQELSLSELGALLGVSRERVRQLELRAKRKIEQHLRRLPREAELLLVS
ncbi:MAG: sigma-70 family RNA polymerase sigma factor [Polyangiaceae bacterium]|nr:sigma-70 family RNA polymerase sigma factor [Polyangiaceae bacterium]MCW5789419.1 sigma-70 family RNA polymerase sigma factor [Polyangiaceae bacterium]